MKHFSRECSTVGWLVGRPCMEVCVCVCWCVLPLVSTGVLVLLVTILGARSREMSLKGSTVVDTLLQGNTGRRD